MILRRTILATALVLAGSALALGYLTDSEVRPPPKDYLQTAAPPPVGSRYRDMVFNRPAGDPDWITRITDARRTSRADGVPGNLRWITPEYSTTSPFNNDRSRLVLIHETYFALYSGKGAFVRNLVEICASCSPRWSRTDANILYYTKVRGIYRYNAGSNTHELLASLDYDALLPRGEDDICFDGDHLIGFGNRGDDYFLYVFSISQAAIVAEQRIGDRPAFGNIDSAEIAPGDNVIVTFVANDRNAEGLAGHGIWAYNLNLEALRQVSTSGGHHDVGRDVNGSPILVINNSASYHPVPNCDNGIEKIEINTPLNRTCLLSLHWTMAVHVSLPDQSGWAFVSTFAPGDPVYGAMGRKEEASPSLSFTEGWNLSANPLHSGGKAMWSDTNTARMTFWFYGTSFEWIAYRDSKSGIARITIDDETALVDLYSRVAIPQVVSHRRDNLPPVRYANMPPGFHRVIVEVTNTKNSASTGYKIWVDAVEDNTPWASYTNEIMQVGLAGGEIRRLAHHRSRPFDPYTYAPKASASWDGKAIVFTSNYGVIKEAYTNNADTYLMEMSTKP